MSDKVTKGTGAYIGKDTYYSQFTSDLCGGDHDDRALIGAQLLGCLLSPVGIAIRTTATNASADGVTCPHEILRCAQDDDYLQDDDHLPSHRKRRQRRANAAMLGKDV